MNKNVQLDLACIEYQSARMDRQVRGQGTGDLREVFPSTKTSLSASNHRVTTAARPGSRTETTPRAA